MAVRAAAFQSCKLAGHAATGARGSVWRARQRVHPLTLQSDFRPLPG